MDGNTARNHLLGFMHIDKIELSNQSTKQFLQRKRHFFRPANKHAHKIDRTNSKRTVVKKGSHMEIDIRTLLLLCFIVSLMSNCLILIVWRMYKSYYHGLHFLLIGLLLQTVGSLLVSQRGMIPDLLSIILSNVLIISGALFILNGLERFFHQQSQRIYNYVLISIFTFAMIYFTLVHQNLVARKICVSIITILIYGQISWFLLRRLGASFRRIARVTALIMLACCVISMLRIITLVLIPSQTNDLFRSGIVDTFFMIAYLCLSIMMTAGFMMMVSLRSLGDVQTEKEKYIKAFHSSPYAIILTKISDGKVYEVNEGFVRITGYQPSEVVGKTTLEIGLWVSEENRSAFINAAISGTDVREREAEFRIKNGEIITCLISAKIIQAFDEECILTSASDITEMSRIKEKLENMALHDTLTGLPNRHLFYDRAQIAFAHAAREKNKVAVISLDVDSLKYINDHWGHAAGDQVLITIGNRLSALLRKGDTISRFGGDEFVVLLTGVTQAADVRMITQKILESLSMESDIAGNKIVATVSLGIALYPDDGNDIDTLIKKSDKAMYLVKTNGRNGYKFFDEVG